MWPHRSEPGWSAASRLVVVLSLCTAALAGCGGGGGLDPGAPEGLPGAPAAAGDASYNKWMTEISWFIEKRKLTEIVLPGTHDSATYSISGDSASSNDGNPNPCELPVLKQLFEVIDWVERWVIPGFASYVPSCRKIVASWSKAQARNTLEQLSDGVRYFDLRVEADVTGRNFMIVHSLASTNLDNVLKDVKEFYRNQNYDSREIIILDINHVYGVDEGGFAGALVSKIKQTLRTDDGTSMLIPRCSGTGCATATDLTFSKLWETKAQRVVLILKTKNQALFPDNPEIWPDSMIVSTWPNTNTANELTAKLRSNAKEAREASAGGKFSVLQAIRTIGSDGLEIAQGVSSWLFDIFGWETCFAGVCVNNYYLWDPWPMCRHCKQDLLGYGDDTNAQANGYQWVDDLFVPSANIIIIDHYSTDLGWWVGGKQFNQLRTDQYAEAVKEMNRVRYCSSQQTSPSTGGLAGLWGLSGATGDLDGNGEPEMVSLGFSTPPGEQASYYVGWNLRYGHPRFWSDAIPVGGGPLRSNDIPGGVALVDLDPPCAGCAGKPELLMTYSRPDSSGQYTTYLRIGWNLHANGYAEQWSETVVWTGESYLGSAGLAVADLDGNGRPDLVVFHVNQNDAANVYEAKYRIGWDIDEHGKADWRGWHFQEKGPGGWYQNKTLQGLALANLDGNEHFELVTLSGDHVPEGWRRWYRVGWDLAWDSNRDNANVSQWAWPPVQLGYFKSAYVGFAMADANRTGRTNDLLMADPDRYRFVLDLTTTGQIPDTLCSYWDYIKDHFK